MTRLLNFADPHLHRHTFLRIFAYRKLILEMYEPQRAAARLGPDWGIPCWLGGEGVWHGSENFEGLNEGGEYKKKASVIAEFYAPAGNQTPVSRLAVWCVTTTPRKAGVKNFSTNQVFAHFGCSEPLGG